MAAPEQKRPPVQFWPTPPCRIGDRQRKSVPGCIPGRFLAAFGHKDTTLKRLRTGNNNTSDIAGGVLLRNNIHIAVCDAGAVASTLKALRESPATTKAKPKFILATDGQTLEAEELVSSAAGGETLALGAQS